MPVWTSCGEPPRSVEVTSCRLTLFISELLSRRRWVLWVSVWVYVQGGEDSQDPPSCRSFSTKEPLNIGHFCGKWPVKIRDPMSLRHLVGRYPCECVANLPVLLRCEQVVWLSLYLHPFLAGGALVLCHCPCQSVVKNLPVLLRWDQVVWLSLHLHSFAAGGGLVIRRAWFRCIIRGVFRPGQPRAAGTRKRW